MRSGIGMLAVLGVTGLALSAAHGQDYRLEKQPSSYGTSNVSRSGRQATGSSDRAPGGQPSSAVRNYYRELFGEDYETKSGPAAAKAASQEAGGVAQAGHAEPQTIGSQPAAREMRRRPGLTVIHPQPSKVIHAQYDPGKHDQPGKRVIQVRATGTSTSPFGGPSSTVITPGETAVDDQQTMVAQPLASEVGGVKSPSVSIEWVKRGEINVGQNYDFELVVKNTGDVLAHDVIASAYFPASVRLTKAEPKPLVSTDHLKWDFKSLSPGEEKRIQLSMIPTERGRLATNANVRFTGAASGVFDVAEPMLTVAIEGPSKAMVGESATQAVTVSNPGTGVTHNVAIEVRVPEGLQHARGKRLLMEIGSLNPGEARTVSLLLTGVSGGQHAITVDAHGDGGLSQSAEAVVSIVAPSLKLAVDGPNLRYVGRTAKYSVNVGNDGSAATNNVRVIHRIPQGFKFVRADHGGNYDAASRSVNWFVGRLEAGQSIPVNVTLIAETSGGFEHQVRATSEQGAFADAKLDTRVEGTASLVLEIADLDDPVEVGAETAYEIRVHNNGTKAAQNIGLSCELPNGTRLVNADGPTAQITESGVVIFKSLAELAPGARVTYRVHVRGVEEGNQRFRARLTSDSIREPLVFEELTKFYAD